MKIDLQPWTTPNFVTAVTKSRPRQEGMHEAPKWHISDVDAETLAEQCDRFRADFSEEVAQRIEQ